MNLSSFIASQISGMCSWHTWGLHLDVNLGWFGLAMSACVAFVIIRRALPNFFKAHLFFSKKKIAVVEN